MAGFDTIVQGGGGEKSTAILHEDEKLIIRHDQDISGILADNAIERDANSMRYARRPDMGMRKVATIPNVIVEELIAKGIWNNPARLKVWLNDPDNAVFRVHGGRV